MVVTENNRRIFQKVSLIIYCVEFYSGGILQVSPLGAIAPQQTHIPTEYGVSHNVGQYVLTTLYTTQKTMKTKRNLS